MYLQSMTIFPVAMHVELIRKSTRTVTLDGFLLVLDRSRPAMRMDDEESASSSALLPLLTCGRLYRCPPISLQTTGWIGRRWTIGLVLILEHDCRIDLKWLFGEERETIQTDDTIQTTYFHTRLFTSLVE